MPKQTRSDPPSAPSTRQQLSRRRFLKRAAGASTAALAVPFIAPASALGRDGNVAPSERIVMGCIGTGKRGTGDMRIFLKEKDVQVVAVCDVNKGSQLYHLGTACGREPAKKIVESHYTKTAVAGAYKGCKAFGDFRQLLEIDDIDAVLVATPDHWHALISIAAANAGKDIYCEKPLANSVAEGRAVCRAVEKNSRVLQTGTQERSRDNARFASELVRNGRIGKLHTVRIQMPCSEPHHDSVRALKRMPAPEPVPEGLDYDFWLGHTPKVPYTPRRCHFWWRFVLSYGGGEMTDRGAHIIDLAQMGMDTEGTGPVEIEAKGSRETTGLYNTFMDYAFTNTYANGVRMIGENRGPRGVRFEGTKGWVFLNVHGCAIEAEPKSLLKEIIGPDEIHLERSPGHHRNFLDCVKSRKTPVAPAEVGHRTATICHLNNIAMLTESKLAWDPVKERFKGNDAANALLSPHMRAPWSL